MSERSGCGTRMRPEYISETRWEFHSELTDLGEDRANWAACDACTGGKNRVRYVHHIEHPTTGQVLNVGADCACILTGCTNAGEIEEHTETLRHFREVERSGTQCYCKLCTGRIYGDATITPWRQWGILRMFLHSAGSEHEGDLLIVLERERRIVNATGWHFQRERRDVHSIYQASLMTSLPRAHFIEEFERQYFPKPKVVPADPRPNKWTWGPVTHHGPVPDWLRGLEPRKLITEYVPPDEPEMREPFVPKNPDWRKS